MSSMMIDAAKQHVGDILAQAIQYTPNEAAIVVYDTQCPLAEVLTNAYRSCLPDAEFIDFYASVPEEVLSRFDTLKPSDLVVIIQTSSFRLNAFRLRVELFDKSLKVIEHPHLGRMVGDEVNTYVDALAYDSLYYRTVGNALKQRIDEAQHGMLDSDGEQLIYPAGFESAKLNIGDYTGMKNIGGQFPIGEVFTESLDLESVNGRVRIFAFGDVTFSVNQVEKPITLVITNGKVSDVIDSTPEFDKVIANIRADEGEVWLRELGFGMNRAFSKTKIVKDIGTYERMCGVHLSLGSKHSVYKKPMIRRADARHHVDVFAVTKHVYLNDVIVYEDDAWKV